jgi:uncharacterized protein YciI
MTGEDIEAAYAPFVASLRSGGHSEPPEGWPAAMVAAHVAVNNDLIAEAAERVAAGEPDVRYDNAAAIDDDRLAALVAGLDGPGALADVVERSARRLAAAREALAGEPAVTEIAVLITEDGRTLVDGPMPIAALVEGNAGFHLDSHREQLRALEPRRAADPPDEFDSFELIFYYRSDEQPELSDEEEDELQLRHLGHFAHLKATTGLLHTGPLRDQPDDRLRGMGIYRTGSVETARRLAEDDPIVRAGLLRVEAMRWITAKGALPPPSS